jgi:hypothetical protein
VFVAQDESPDLQTASSDLPNAGVIAGFGLLFVAIVVVGVGLVRRNARRRG